MEVTVTRPYKKRTKEERIEAARIKLTAYALRRDIALTKVEMLRKTIERISSLEQREITKLRRMGANRKADEAVEAAQETGHVG